MRSNRIMWNAVKNFLRLGLMSGMVFVLLFGNVMAAPPPDPPPEIYLTEEDSGRTVRWARTRRWSCAW